MARHDHPGRSAATRIVPFTSSSPRHQHHQLKPRMRRRNEVVLHEAHFAVLRVVEHAGAAFAGQDFVIMPEAGEGGAFAQEGVYERLAGGGGGFVDGFGAELGHKALGAGRPVGDEVAGGFVLKDEAQQVWLAALQPRGE